MSQHPPYLRNIHNSRVFPYDENLAKMNNVTPYWGEADAKGVAIDAPPTPDQVPVADVQPSTAPMSLKLQPGEPSPELQPTEATVQDYDGMNARQLKKLVEDRGGTYTTRNDAVAYLSNTAGVE